MSIVRYILGFLSFACLLRVLTTLEEKPDWFDLTLEGTLGTLLLFTGILQLRAARRYERYRWLELGVAMANALLAVGFGVWAVYALYNDPWANVISYSAIGCFFAANGLT